MDVIAIDRLQELENTSCLCMYDIHSCEHAGHVSETWIIISTWYFASHVVVWGGSGLSLLWMIFSLVSLKMGARQYLLSFWLALSSERFIVHYKRPKKYLVQDSVSTWFYSSHHQMMELCQDTSIYSSWLGPPPPQGMESKNGTYLQDIRYNILIKAEEEARLKKKLV